MCVAFLFLADPDADAAVPKVVLCVNRDEAYGRPTLASHWWDNDGEIFAGRDETAGGTWLGVSKTGRVAVLTNYADDVTGTVAETTGLPMPSRGTLVSEFLSSANTDAPTAFLQKLTSSLNQFNGFNLIAGDLRSGEFAYLGNRGGVANASPCRLDLGANFLSTAAEANGSKTILKLGVVHGLSNATLDTRGEKAWPKVVRGKDRLARAVSAFCIRKQCNVVASVDRLDHETQYADFAVSLLSEVLENVEATGNTSDDTTRDVSEKEMSANLRDNPSAFVKPGGATRNRTSYGTRCSTVITCSGDEVVCVEKSATWREGKPTWLAPAVTKFTIDARKKE